MSDHVFGNEDLQVVPAVVDQEGVAGRHAEISVVEEGGLQILSLDPGSDILLNGEAVQQASLASGDEIRIANCRWVLQAPGLRPEKVLTDAAIKPRRSLVPWLVVGGLVAAAALAWYTGQLPF